MLAVSIRSGKRKMVAVLAAVLLVATLVIVCVKMAGSASAGGGADVKYSVKAGTPEERIAFFNQFGWQVKTEPLSEKAIVIPLTFDDVYTNYNNVQLEQGMDLRRYAGKTCTQWVYEITNYQEEPSVLGTILVLDGRVVGGDLSTPALDGFMTGFSGRIDSGDYALAGPALTRAEDGALTMASAAPVTSAVEEASPASSEIPANAWPTD